MREDEHVTVNIVPTDPPKPTVLAPAREPAVNPSAPPSTPVSNEEKCKCGWESKNVEEEANVHYQSNFPGNKTLTRYVVCPKCNTVLRIYMESTRGTR